MSTNLILFFIGASIFGIAIAVIFSVDSISGKLFGQSSKENRDKPLN